MDVQTKGLPFSGKQADWLDLSGSANTLPPLTEQLIHASFVKVARRSPERTALIADGGCFTYGELDDLSSRLAQQLSSSGVASGQVVAILTDRNAELVCAILAVLKAGAAFAMIDAAYPAARVREMFALIAPAFLLVAGEVDTRPLGLPTDLPSFRLPRGPEALGALLAAVPSHTPERDVRPGLAYLSFTSGSTGAPKVIATGHPPLPHFVAWHVAEFGLHESDRFSLLSGVAHDPLLRDIFTPLSIGATLHIPTQKTLYDPSALARWLGASGVTVCHLTPALGQIILASASPGMLPQLRYMFWGGDSLKPDTLQTLMTVAPVAQHVNFYGTTETPQAVAFHRIDPGAVVQRFPIGKGIADVHILVLRDDHSHAPQGELGEVCVRTRYLSLGYFGDDAGTHSKYAVNPDTGDIGDRIYRTGDLGVVLPDGSVDLRGRADDQVKIRGYRVELGEVAAALRKHGSVADAVVLARALPCGDQQLVGFVVTKPGCTLESTRLGQHTRALLPTSMQPAAYVSLQQLPLLPNGKLDRAALRALPIVHEPRAEDSAPLDAEAKKLVDIWREVLGVPAVSIHDSFYDLGGDSLTAIRVMMRMRMSGIDERICRGILQGKSIAALLGRTSGEGAHEALPSFSLPQHQRLLLNVLRGVLVLLLVMGHWAPGFLRRVPQLREHLVGLSVLFNVATPGFAIAFGMTLGFIYYPLYCTDPARARALLLRGATVVGLGMLLFALVRVLMNALSPDQWWHPFGNVLPYYALALATVPLWFRVLSLTRRPEVTACALACGFVLANHQVRQIAWSESTWASVGFLLGKYSYLNLSAGAMLGMVLGISLKRSGRVLPLYAWLGAALMLATFGVISRYGTLLQLSVADDVQPWKWTFYGGACMLSFFALDRLLPYTVRAAVGVRVGVRTLAVVGQLGLPLFILNFVATDLGNVASTLHAPPWADVAVSLGVFGAGAGLLVVRVYTLLHAPVDGLLDTADLDAGSRLSDAPEVMVG